MGRMSKEKGKRGEREIAALFRAYGFQARRSQQYQGGPDSPDIVHNLPGDLYVEVKFRENASPFAALEQASRDAALEDAPIVFMRKSRKPWVVVMHADDFLDLMQRFEGYRQFQEDV